MFTGAKANNGFRIIAKGKYQGLQTKGQKQKNTDAIVRLHKRMQP